MLVVQARTPREVLERSTRESKTSMRNLRMSGRSNRQFFRRLLPASCCLFASRRPAQWATLDELLDKLLFLAVSGDGTSTTNFSNTVSDLYSTRSFIYHAFPTNLPKVCNSKKNHTSYAETHASTGQSIRRPYVCMFCSNEVSSYDVCAGMTFSTR